MKETFIFSFLIFFGLFIDLEKRKTFNTFFYTKLDFVAVISIYDLQRTIKTRVSYLIGV